MIVKWSIDFSQLKEGETVQQYQARYLKENKLKVVFVNHEEVIISNDYEDGLTYSLTSVDKEIGDKL